MSTAKLTQEDVLTLRTIRSLAAKADRSTSAANAVYRVELSAHEDALSEGAKAAYLT